MIFNANLVLIMFKESTTSAQIDFLGDVTGNLDARRAKIINDPNTWYNQFFEHIVCRLDETCFDVLYSKQMGRTNAPIRTLLGMMSLKEGFGWSDKQLYEQISFNLLVMKALGFENLGDTPPALSTYYLFKQSVYQYHVEQGQDLVEKAFQSLTKSQAEFFDVDGKKVRMDSKLIGSNIVRCSRLQLIISCLQAFWKDLNSELKSKLNDEKQQVLNDLCKNKPNQIVYPLSEKKKSQMLLDLGILLLEIQTHFDDSDSDHYHLINRILDEQYRIEDEQPVLKPGKEISANSVQSPHDPDAAYRSKKQQSVNGYSINMTETCNDEGLNLIVDVQTEKATFADVHFVEPSLNNVQAVLGEVDTSYQDGAYQSPDNKNYGKDNDIEMIFTGIQGAKGNFEFIPTDDEMFVRDIEADVLLKATEYKDGHYKITQLNGKTRYFKPDQVKNYQYRLEQEKIPRKVKNKRNNVEATIFQLCYYSRNNKTRYRGNLRTKVWAISRSMWINLIRIRNYVQNMEKQKLSPVV